MWRGREAAAAAEPPYARPCTVALALFRPMRPLGGKPLRRRRFKGKCRH